jgi:glycosyltransferase involved in cell wall biosynthesis
MSQASISVVIPLYNEESAVETAVLTTIATVSSFTADYEIILINDASTDNTLKVIDEKFSTYPAVVILDRKANGGFGAAVRSGIELSTKDYIICAPADSPLRIDTFSAFYANMDKGDIIVSYRRERKGYSLRMRLNAFIYHQLISVLFGMDLKDYNWIHLYNRKIFNTGSIVIEYDGIFMLAEVLIKAKRQGYTFYEVPVDQDERLTGIATSSRWPAVLSTLRDLIRFYFTVKPNATT